MELYKQLTIVIPCKNESKTIDTTLTLLNFQNNIENVNVIVADSSDDETTYQLESRNNDKFKLTIIDGGLPGVARNKGAELVRTPYVLFLDSDMFILDNNLLTEAISSIRKRRLDLITTKVRTHNGKFNYVFKIFDIIQLITKPFSPFCLGGFMLFKLKTFTKLGGFDEDAKVAEDYLLSKKVLGKKVKILNKIVFTPPRRFENKGIIYMVKLMISSFINQNNKKFFSKHKTYWK